MDLRVDRSNVHKVHAVELKAKMKDLKDCEAVRSLELEQRERLDVDCNKLQSQLLVVEE